MSRVTTYEQWFSAQPPGHSYPRTLDEVELLANDVRRNGSECDSTAETLAIVVEGLLAELRERRAADLSAEDVEALTFAIWVLSTEASRRQGAAPHGWQNRAQHAISVLNRLLPKGVGR